MTESHSVGVRLCDSGRMDSVFRTNSRSPDGMIDEDAIRTRWETVGSKLNERGRRLFAAGEVRAAGWGSLAVVSRITGLARPTINRGEDDLDAAPLAKGRVRSSGATHGDYRLRNQGFFGVDPRRRAA